MDIDISVGNVKGPAYYLSKPQIVGNYSIDGNRQYSNNLSQMKYYKQPLDPHNVRLDLNCNQGTIYKSEIFNIKLDYMLKWILENFTSLETRDCCQSSTGQR